MLRDPCGYLESLYDELQRQEMAPKFDQYVADAVAGRGVVIDYRRIVRVFAWAFGAEALRVLPYNGHDAVTPVLAVCSETMRTTLPPIAGWPRFNVRSQGQILLNGAQRTAIGASVGDVVGEIVDVFGDTARDGAQAQANADRARGVPLGHDVPVSARDVA